MNLLDARAAQSEVEWLAIEDPTGGETGFSVPSIYDDRVWLLHSIYQFDLPIDLTMDELERLRGEAGEPPLIINGVNITESTTATNIPFGLAGSPGAGWHRRLWADLLAESGRKLGEGQAFRPSFQWIPDRTSAGIQGPPEGSLDREMRDALWDVLSGGEDPECFAHYSSVARFVQRDWKELPEIMVYRGRLSELAAISEERRSTPNNVWPVDRSWLLYTDYDLSGTQIGGSTSLIHALENDERFEVLR